MLQMKEKLYERETRYGRLQVNIDGLNNGWHGVESKFWITRA